MGGSMEDIIIILNFKRNSPRSNEKGYKEHNFFLYAEFEIYLLLIFLLIFLRQKLFTLNYQSEFLQKVIN